MDDMRRLVAALWKPFVREIAQGGPVFFSFSAEMLADLFRREHIETDDPVRTIREFASQLYVVDDDEVYLRPDALRAGEAGFSPAIVLVCQQVLAIEEMVRDPGGFSENAYFPRLRRLMSEALPRLSQNPFAFDEFEAIWRTLASEIRSLPGGTDGCITFRFGLETGINKARSFPLSQGLLSLEDLRIVTKEIGPRRLSTGTPAEIWRLLKRVKSRLGRRGQRLIGLGIFRDRVIEQVVAFAARPDALSPLKPAVGQETAQAVELNIYKDSTDWVSEEFRAFLTIIETGRRIDDEQRLTELLSTRFRQGETLVLPPGEFGDHWVCTNKTLDIRHGDTFLIVGTPSSIARSVQSFEALGLPLSAIGENRWSLGLGAGIQVAEASIPKDSTLVVTVRDGRIVDSARESAQPPYVWIGGHCVDARGERFLRDFLPSGIRFAGTLVRIQEMIKVDDRFLTFDAFRAAIERETEDLSAEIAFPNGRSARLGVAICRQAGDESLGYLVDANGVVSPVTDIVNKSDFAVVGCSERRRSSAERLPISLCVRLMEGLKQGTGDELNRDELEWLRNRVAASSLPSEVHVVIGKLLQRSPRLPDGVRDELWRS